MKLYVVCNSTTYTQMPINFDINFFGIAQTCSEAGIGVGCCPWTSSSSCYVGGGDCYCDSYCVVFNDCCGDVPVPQCCESYT